MPRKQIDFKTTELLKSIQLYANHNHNGNFNAAVRDLCKQALEGQGEKK